MFKEFENSILFDLGKRVSLPNKNHRFDVQLTNACNFINLVGTYVIDWTSL